LRGVPSSVLTTTPSGMTTLAFNILRMISMSHGFRPGRSCHTAIAEARQHLEEGYGWVVDLDLETFFDRVPHDRLIASRAAAPTRQGPAARHDREEGCD
jgi:reverse transcriptase-like protein